MNIYPVHAGNFKLDGGAMFGVVPKKLWSRTNPPDENNMCSWAMRCMLIEQDNRLILIDTGMGNKQSDKFFGFYYPHGDQNLIKSIKEIGFKPEDITDVFLTHLHFDHCGGAVEWADEEQTKLVPVFKNATYWSTEQHWKWATEPNQREKASFLKENILPLEKSGQLKFIERKGDYTKNVFPGIDVFFADGHTESQMIPHIQYQGETLVYMADLLPSIGHIPLPYVMGYDTRPLMTLNEKEKFLRKATDESYILFLEHDIENEMCRLKDTEKGPRLKETYRFDKYFS